MTTNGHSIIVSCASSLLAAGSHSMAATVAALLARPDVVGVDAFAYVTDGWMLRSSGLVAARARTRILFRPPDGAARRDVEDLTRVSIPGLHVRQLDLARVASERVHAKIVNIELANGSLYTILGSSNLTHRGYHDNIEVNVLVGEPQSREVSRVFEELWSGSIAVNPRMFELRPSIPGDADSSVVAKPTLLPFQMEVYTRICQLYEAKESGAILSLPTGAGKTIVAVRFILDEVLKHKRNVLWVAPHRELLVQAASTFELCFPAYGMPGIEVQPSALVVRDDIGAAAREDYAVEFITNQGTPSRDTYDVVVVDEAHYGASMHRILLPDLRDRYKRAFFLGLTGTPFRSRLDEVQHLKQLFGGLVDRSFNEIESVRDVHGRRVLSEVRSMKVDTGFKIRVDQKQWEAEELSEAALGTFDDPVRNRAVARAWVSSYGKTLVFTSSADHANNLARAFAKEQPNATVQVLHTRPIPNNVRTVIRPRGETFATGEREQVRRVFGALDHRIDILISVNLYVMGVDFPAVRTLFMARPTLSPVLYAQMKGRGLRGPAFGGTEQVTVVDFVDQAETHHHLATRLMTFARESAWSDETEKQLDQIRVLMRRVKNDAPGEIRDRMQRVGGLYRVQTPAVTYVQRDWRWVADIGRAVKNGLGDKTVRSSDHVLWIGEPDGAKGSEFASLLRLGESLGIVDPSTWRQ